MCLVESILRVELYNFTYPFIIHWYRIIRVSISKVRIYLMRVLDNILSFLSFVAPDFDEFNQVLPIPIQWAADQIRFENRIMLNKIIAKIVDIILAILVTIYIVLEELIWENIAEPIYIFIHGLAILQKAEEFVYKLNRYILLVLFLALFINVELLGIFALKLIGSGEVTIGTTLYAGRIPLVAFTFWLFRLSKEKLLTFNWFKQAYEFVISIIDRIKLSSIHQRIAARFKIVKEWFKSRLSMYNPLPYMIKIMKILRSPKSIDKGDWRFENSTRWNLECA